MPRVRPLTATQARRELDRRSNQTFTDAAALYKLHSRTTDKDIGDKLGINSHKVYRMRRSPGKVDLDDIRAFAHAIGMTQEDWLKLGGYKV